MRLLRSLLWLVVLGGLGIIALLFLVQNLHTERIVFFGLVATLNFALVVAGAVALGFVLALVLIVPGRIATALYARSLDREVGQLERQVAQLSELRERLLDGREQLLQRYERLYADHGKVTAERERIRAQLAAATAATAAAQPTPNRAAGERGPAAAAALARQPLALKEREAGHEVRAAPVRIAPPIAGERRPASAPAIASATASAPVIAPASAPAPATAPTPAPAAPLEIAAPPAQALARAQSVPQLPPIPVASDPAAVDRPLAAPRAPQPPEPAEPPAVFAAPDPPTAASTEPGEPVAPPMPARAGQVRERITRHTTAALGQLRQVRSQAGRVRRSTGTMYNEVRTTLLARARAIAANSGRRFATPSASAQRDSVPPDSRASSASAASARDEDGHESSTLKGEQPVWRPPE